MSRGMLMDLAVSSRRAMEERRSRMPFHSLEQRLHAVLGSAPPSFVKGLQGPGVSLIAEHKRASPSKGPIRTDLGVEEVVGQYARAGAAAVSVLTEGSGFRGCLAHLERARAAHPGLPLLMKDFVIDEYQIMEGRLSGASAVLLIASLLGAGTLKRLLSFARSIGLDVLTEVHTEAELDTALQAGADMVGVNSRNLDTFRVDLGTAESMGYLIPPGVIGVAESGVRSPRDIRRLASAGYKAVLVGEALMREASPYHAAKAMVDAGASPLPLVKICGITRPSDAVMAASEGADMLGLIFAPGSRRELTIEKAATIAMVVNGMASPPAVVGVFRDRTVEGVADTANKLGLRHIQLHGSESPDYCSRLMALTPRVSIIKAFGADEPGGIIERVSPYTGVLGPNAMILLDTPAHHGGVGGGTGMTWDWSLAGSLRRTMPGIRFIMAGGLNPRNAGTAWRESGAWALDASSGLELRGSPGIKDPSLVRGFIGAVRSAAKGCSINGC